MKSLISLATVSILMLSCSKKDWNCTCVVNGDDYAKVIPNTTKSKAGANCSDYGKSIGQMYGSYTYKCEVN